MPKYSRRNSLKRKSLKRKSLKRKSLKRKSLKKRSFRRTKKLRGGALAEQEFKELQQKIDTLNDAIARQDNDEVAEFDGGTDHYTCGGIGNPTGQVSRQFGLPYVANDEGQTRRAQHQRIQQDKIYARDYFQNILNNLQVFNQTNFARGLPDEVVANIIKKS